MTEQSTDGQSLLGILDELSELISSARAMPMSASALVNRAEVMDLISSAREVLPQQLAQADKIRQDAENILDNARAQAQELVSDQAIVVEAEKKAQEIIADAEVKAEKLAREADEYCDQKLAEFEIDLNKITTQVAAGRQRLHQRSAGENT